MSRALAESTVFHAIADPTRRAILDMLREGERDVTSMLDGARRQRRRVSQPAMSLHLAVLRRAGLVQRERHGRRQVYSIRPDPLREVSQWITFFDRFWTEKLDNLKRYLEKQAATKPAADSSAPDSPTPHDQRSDA